MNLMGPMSEEEQKQWAKGANSETSMRTYSKEYSGPPARGRGAPRGSERGGRIGGRGFERHRSVNEEDEREERGRGRGKRW